MKAFLHSFHCWPVIYILFCQNDKLQINIGHNTSENRPSVLDQCQATAHCVTFVFVCLDIVEQLTVCLGGPVASVGHKKFKSIISGEGKDHSSQVCQLNCTKTFHKLSSADCFTLNLSECSVSCYTMSPVFSNKLQRRGNNGWNSHITMLYGKVCSFASSILSLIVNKAGLLLPRRPSKIIALVWICI